MSNPKWEEQIIVVPRDVLFENESLAFQGVIVPEGENHDKGAKILQNLAINYSTMRRGNEADPTPAENNAEINPEFKQIIPYVVIRKGDKYFAYKRLSGGGESRLVNRISIGAGGHMNDVAEELYQTGVTFEHVLMDNVEREVTKEELDIDTEEMDFEVIGLINDDSDLVGEVHFGILIILDLSENVNVAVKETDQLEGSWMSITELLKPENSEKLENWSRIALEALN
jgi:predicted NUDIX family phosphoesterase